MNPEKTSTKSSFDAFAIPAFAGKQAVTSKFQRRTQLQYITAALAGTLSFYGSQNAHLRVAGLSCLFPGAGFIAVGGMTGTIGFLLTLAFLPLSLFAWFGAGGLAFVYANWLIPAIVSSLVAKSIWELSAPVVICVVAALCLWLVQAGYSRQASALKLRDSRNTFLDSEDAAWRTRVSQQAQIGRRELSKDELLLLQHFVQLSHQSFDDWSNFSRIDQFQTSALRYQLYDLQYTLAFVQKHYMPNFHGYIKKGQENVIEKSLTKDVMNYWKWESLWGKFTTDWDPVVRDNIMVTGYLLICLATYEKLTGDNQYNLAGALEFEITKKARYHHNTDSVFNALMQNWDDCAYCLFPCEPNWIYTGCNLIGMQGALAYDSCRKTGRVQPLLEGRYYRSFEEDFVNPDGSVVALRSAITGFQIIGLAGVIGDIGGALTCAATMPNLGRRLWLMSRKTNVEMKDGRWKLVNLVGADKIDVGSYAPGEGFAHAIASQCAAEYGEEDVRQDLLKHLDENLHPVIRSPTGSGALMNGGLSVLAMGYAFRARIAKKGDWSELINCPVDSASLAAPKLHNVPFPEIMVARCYAYQSTGLDFVLRGPSEESQFTIQLKDLQNGAKYSISVVDKNGSKTVIASNIQGDAKGVAEVSIIVGDRGEFELRVLGDVRV